jgi:hypothetical protein
MNASEMARALGQRGGRARARRLSAAECRQIASMGGNARQQSLLAARRITDTLRYAHAVDALRGRSNAVKRLKRFSGPLPSIHPGRS